MVSRLRRFEFVRWHLSPGCAVSAQLHPGLHNGVASTRLFGHPLHTQNAAWLAPTYAKVVNRAIRESFYPIVSKEHRCNNMSPDKHPLLYIIYIMRRYCVSGEVGWLWLKRGPPCPFHQQKGLLNYSRSPFCWSGFMRLKAHVAPFGNWVVVLCLLGVNDNSNWHQTCFY
jgi:hypothetical protein